MENKIEEFVQDIEMYSAEQARSIAAVREIYRGTVPDVSEKFIYGGIGFYRDTKLIGGVYSYKKHISIVFSRGNELTDPDGLLEGGGKYRRHLKALVSSDVVTKQVEFFVKQAVALLDE